MGKLKLNLAVDKIAVFANNGTPIVGIPSGWPEAKYFNQDYSIFAFSPEEIKEKFQVEFPLNWDIISEEKRHNLNSRIWPHHTLSNFPTAGVDVNFNTVDFYLESNENFVYIIHILDDTIFKDNVFKINPKVCDLANKGICKVLIYFPAEGYINHAKPIEWLTNFAHFNNIKKESFIFTHANLTFNKAIREYKNTGGEVGFTYLPLNYFEINPWFIDSPHQKYIRKTLLSNLDKFVNENRNKTFRKHFNILNRRPHNHRILLFTEVMSNENLREKCEISLGNQLLISKGPLLELIDDLENRHGGWDLNKEFSRDWDFTKEYILDKDLSDNRAGEYTRHFYRDTFCSVTSETAVLINQMFFSEKTFKPIFNLQPFIMYGNAYSLQHLQELGYKTFSDWWDESYDLEEDYAKRLKMISKVMEEICTWSYDKLHSVTQEMEKTLIHNFNNFLFSTRYLEYIKELAKFNKTPSKTSFRRLI